MLTERAARGAALGTPLSGGFVLSKFSLTRRAVVTAAASISLAASALVAPSVIAAPTQSAAQPAKIDAKLSAALAKGTADFFVRFSAKADLTAASQMTDWDARGQAVYDALTRVADASQAPVRKYLDSQHATYETFWAANAILVTKGNADLASRLTTFTGVSKLAAPMAVELQQPKVEASIDAPGSIEWGIQNIKADQVWNQFGDRGKGIVVASIDTGVQYNHPALVKQYRGKKKHGKFNHNYNWYDGSQTGHTVPFDSQSHGTHTMGTMIGDDRGANQIGVAPRAKWIAAYGCCPSEAALVRSGQWMLAPTKINGSSPKPSKRPDIVNNSWGYTDPNGQETLFDSIITAWDAAGIFGQWSIGNMGSGCNTDGAPGARPAAYAAGAYDINNQIAGFSSRGPGLGSDIKPNISAPGVNVRSSVPGGYGNLSGTSMASPHVAGAIALLWSAAPSLRGDIPATHAALDKAGIDVDATQCGGTKADNNVFGEGRLDALSLVQSASAAGLVPDRFAH
jgi:subtilisin family serine protease